MPLGTIKYFFVVCLYLSEHIIFHACLMHRAQYFKSTLDGVVCQAMKRAPVSTILEIACFCVLDPCRA